MNLDSCLGTHASIDWQEVLDWEQRLRESVTYLEQEVGNSDNGAPHPEMTTVWPDRRRHLAQNNGRLDTVRRWIM
ncbi:hypothetical protein [Bradyrhizobium elkanii]|uniref:hypothetical protein n=1 Tax=Bradyrhizobium elkanii TaxID=29448 RepID=UPI001BAC1E00|nr:hypothetical protein [Bradyrhizobium elkanii]MBR1164790.1 hypothetical protein [Bradyrhizobium elkanii]